MQDATTRRDRNSVPVAPPDEAGQGAEDTRPSHHGPNGRFQNPWPTARAPRGWPSLLRWQWERRRVDLAPDPKPSDLPAATPLIAQPYASPFELRATWVGHSTWLL